MSGGEVAAERRMKDSGIEWIGEIPEDWEVIKYKHISSVQSGYPFDSSKFTNENGFPLIRIRDITSGNTETFYSGEFSEEYIVRKGDCIVGMDGDFNVRMWASNDALLNQRCCKIQVNEDVALKYIYYSLPFCLNYINELTYATTVKHLSVGDIGDSFVPFPSYQQQIIISTYLDQKCSAIDSAIEKQRSIIEKLKEYRQSVITEAVTKGLNPDAVMKESGVDWVGEIPEGWNLIISRYVIENISDVDHYMPESKDEGYPYAMTGDLADLVSKIDFETCKKISDSEYATLSRKSKPHLGDIIFARYATIGTVCYVDVDTDFLVSYSCVTIHPDNLKLDGRYFYWSLKSHTFSENVQKFVNSNTQGNIGVDSLYHIKVIVPPLSEQKEIANYLDKKCAAIDDVISKKEGVIEKLEEYKKSLIYECVTGKREVI